MCPQSLLVCTLRRLTGSFEVLRVLASGWFNGQVPDACTKTRSCSISVPGPARHLLAKDHLRRVAAAPGKAGASSLG